MAAAPAQTDVGQASANIAAEGEDAFGSDLADFI
jgi:hypothetical protein